MNLFDFAIQFVESDALEVCCQFTKDQSFINTKTLQVNLSFAHAFFKLYRLRSIAYINEDDFIILQSLCMMFRRNYI
jgi:hypothetical protein